MLIRGRENYVIKDVSAPGTSVGNGLLTSGLDFKLFHGFQRLWEVLHWFYREDISTIV